MNVLLSAGHVPLALSVGVVLAMYQRGLTRGQLHFDPLEISLSVGCKKKLLDGCYN